ncbi:MAG TPA: Asp-tRNA(Asn)/Glu-tRNA(Gln) amidotransferase GatCAB subunit A [Gammaproteobacteria bacterium]|nr:Asp-tRNA(Asn)/Glu-tRNA(Gln) amidotransferase GatCAB subunit A [Gammaproteobacteria bacterium]HCP50674.1 Asp-tRNA(Asn)/Glu-tRNA(Gln) amidotransferase GatCAB subunit A [Gammaproteobacteria bacterium]|tara:strand:- start:657 stop:2051 length:1395 start_codon:yes stop_codon:yes gene_type:complete
MGFHYSSLSDICRKTKSGELRVVNVVETMLQRIQDLEPSLSAYVTVTADEAIQQAEVLDARQREGAPLGVLHGAPIGLKDLLWTKGIPTSGGMHMHREWCPEENAAVVERLGEAGAVSLGKLKLTEGAYADHHPEVTAPKNPWNTDYWTGVSSSGSGVAVAAGMAHGAIGTDTGGSIRFPSACCGLVGLKPTYGRVSRYGGFALADSLDHFGPMARSVEDVARMLQAIAGFDPKDPTSLNAEVPNYLAPGCRDLTDTVVGVDWAYCEDGVETSVQESTRMAVESCRDAGAQIVEITLPERQELIERWMVTCSVECAFAHRSSYPTKASEYGPTLRRLLEFGTAKATAVEYASLERARERFRCELDGVLGSVDVVISPCMPTSPPRVDSMAEDASDVGDAAPMLTFTAPFDYSGHPTLTLPLDLNASGLPRSFQFIGSRLGERRLIEIGLVIEAAIGFDQHPDLD